MSIPSLLSHIGMHVPRGVSIDGRIIIGSEARTAISQGTATAVAPHTFHGGNDPTGRTDRTPWWEEDERRNRDIEAVRSAFPGFQLVEPRDYVWRGVIDTGRGRFQVALKGNPSGRVPSIVMEHPRRLERPEGRRMRRSPHLYDSGALCVAAEEDWNRDQHTTATAIAWTAHWLAAYSEWRMSGHWPTPGYVPRATG